MPQHNPDVKKGKKMKKVNRPKTDGRSAPRTTKKPFRLEVGKTYESEKGLKIKVRLGRGSPGEFWGAGKYGVWAADGSLVFTTGITAHKYGRLIREVRQPKAPVAPSGRRVPHA
jgi:hypothetical protein